MSPTTPAATEVITALLTTTRDALTHPPPHTDPSLLPAGRAALALLTSDPRAARDLAYAQLHAVPYREVRACWRRLYVDAVLWALLEASENQEDGGEVGGEKWLTQTVEMLDMALILTGAPGREELVEAWLEGLQGVVDAREDEHEGKGFDIDIDIHIDATTPEKNRPSKRRRLSPTSDPSLSLPTAFPTPLPALPLTHPIPRHPSTTLSLSAFEALIADPQSQHPLIITGAIDHWPALDDPRRAWNDPNYLLRKTLGGRRLVPVEIGRSYTDEGWGQRILGFGDFVREFLLDDGESAGDEEHKTCASKATSKSEKKHRQKGYLAQHNLFAQIPSLRADIAIPDYCYSCPPFPSPSSSPPTPQLDEPLLNAWFGPAHTISPLHTDPYHNVLAQVVGYKYVRLYAPSETAKMHPRGTEGGVDMGNTSAVDLDAAVGRWPQIAGGLAGVGAGHERAGEGDENENGNGNGNGKGDEDDGFDGERFAAFQDASFVEGVLAPGECLYIPAGWWHYVRSVTVSFSVSFWWN